MEAHTDKGNMGRWGSDDGKKSREALSHVHERCEDDALQSQRISVPDGTEGRTAIRPLSRSFTDFKKIRRHQANEEFRFDT